MKYLGNSMIYLPCNLQFFSLNLLNNGLEESDIQKFWDYS